jgi:hypothetical protein
MASVHTAEELVKYLLVSKPVRWSRSRDTSADAAA